MQKSSATSDERKKTAPDPLYRFKADLGHLHSLCFLQASAARHLLLAAGESGVVHFIDLANNRLLRQRKLGISIQTILQHEDELIVQEKEGLVTFYRLLSDDVGEKTACVRCASGFCKMLLFGDALFFPLDDGAVAVYDLRDKRVVRTLKHGDDYGQLMCLASAAQDALFAGYETGDVLLWNLFGDDDVPIAHGKFAPCIVTLSYDAKTRRGVVGGVGDALQVFALDAHGAIRQLAELTLPNAGCQVARMRPDGRLLVAGGFDGRTRVYSWRTLRLLAALGANRASVADVQFSAGVVPMAVGGADGVITFWNLYE